MSFSGSKYLKQIQYNSNAQPHGEWVWEAPSHYERINYLNGKRHGLYVLIHTTHDWPATNRMYRFGNAFGEELIHE